MTMLEDRLRKGLAAEADARPLPTRLPQVSPTHSVKGARIALAAAAVTLVVVGGTTFVSRVADPTNEVSVAAPGAPDVPATSLPAEPVGASTADDPATLPTTPAATASTDEFEEPFEAFPFSGESWNLKVMEAGPGTYKVCHVFSDPSQPVEISGFGPSGCSNWPSDATGYFIDAQAVTTPDGTVVLFVDLTDNPVALVQVTNEAGETFEAEPYAMPGSGKQFAVIDGNQLQGSLTIQLLNDSATVLEQTEVTE